jgi:hypothetical protein
MVLLLFLHDLGDGGHRGVVFAIEASQLLLEMAEHYALNGHGGGCNRLAPEHCRDNPKEVPTHGTKLIAAAAWKTAAIELCEEDGAVLLFVSLELCKFGQERWGRESCYEDLPSVDVYRAVLPGVIDLEHAATKYRVCA